MPLDVPTTGITDSISLDEFIIAISKSNYDFSSYADLIDAGKYLKRLSNNRGFLLDMMFSELESFSTFQQNNFYGPQVFLIHNEESYFLRANVWNPLSAVEKQMEGHVYDVCHDHNFDILTVGYFGPGYQARTYTYDVQSVTGMLGEKVDLDETGIFTLNEGRVALYRAKKDVHIQIPPDELSVSLNLIPKNSKASGPQFQFDEKSHTICRYLHSSGSELTVRLAGLIGGKHALKDLRAISESHSNDHLRALSIVALAELTPSGTATDTQEGIHPDHPLVADIVNREMEQYGGALRLVVASPSGP